MKIIKIIPALKTAAREDTGNTTNTGVAGLGPITCRYYPYCNRHTFWLGSSAISLRDLRTWLREGGW